MDRVDRVDGISCLICENLTITKQLDILDHFTFVESCVAFKSWRTVQFIYLVSCIPSVLTVRGIR